MTYNNELYKEVQPYLHSGEEILWLGKPYTSRSFHVSPFLAVFSLFWCGFAVLWTVMATSIGGPFGFFGIPFILFGIYFIYSVFVGQKKMLNTAVYAVTDRRAIIILYGKHGANCTEYVFSALSNISLEDVQGDTGTIRFAQSHSYYDNYYGRRRNTYDHRRELGTAFFMIDQVHTVYRMISEQLGR